MRFIKTTNAKGVERLDGDGIPSYDIAKIEEFLKSINAIHVSDTYHNGAFEVYSTEGYLIGVVYYNSDSEDYWVDLNDYGASDD